MTTPLTSYTMTPPVVFFEALPDDLPAEGAVSAEARGLTEHAAEVRAAYDDAAASWAGLSDGRFDVPDGEVVRTALQDTVLPHVQDHEEVTGAARDALDAFDADVAELAPAIRQAIADGEALNVTPVTDRDEDFHRRVQLQQEHIHALGARYDEIVQTCVDAINGAGGHRRPSAAVGMLGAGVSGAKIGHEFARNFGSAQVTQPYRKDGRLTIGFDSEKFTAENRRAYRGPKLPQSLYRKAGVPQNYLDKFSDAASSDGTRVSNSDTQRMLKSVDGTNTPLGKLVGAVPSLKNSKLNFVGDRLEVRAELTGGDRKPPSGAVKTPTAAAKAVSAIEKVGNSPWSKALGPASWMVSGAGNYSASYNERRAEAPEATERELHKHAARDMAFKTGAEALGSSVGTAIGTSVGVAVGQTLIPIPGVGAAVGGFVGGLAGGAIGGYIGNAVGDGINAGIDAAIDQGTDVIDSTVEGAKEAFSSLNPFD